ncbi:SRPBCC family protein [Phycicoccus sp. 3266]|uniref:SRPBCC family protein n=1 Tax=Phycicoccus sp. 3266 TaxID=2817751 RepID=UPI002860A267|nr:SRPBCC family protein [Phycicoccus sp. 3266]MDR6862724.1 putative membrane protein [Phycicoccus sp. 3266]
MVRASRTVVINRPIEDVFAFFTTHSNDKSWRSHVKEISDGGPPGVGAHIHQVVRGPGGRGIPADVEVTGYEPPTRYTFVAVTGPVGPAGEFRFRSLGGATEVTLTLGAELGGLKSLLMSRSVQNAMDSEVAGLEKAKRQLEAT